jgi:DNA-binding MarR family transcriptional regulator
MLVPMATTPTTTDGDPAATPVPWLVGTEQEAWRSFIETSRWVLEMLDRDLKAHGITGDDYAVLVVLAEQPERRLRMSELAERVYESKSRLSHHINRLEAKGLVRREACPSDRRGLNAVLSDDGAALLESAAPDHVRSVRRHFLDHFEPDELQMIATAFGAAAERLGELRGAGACPDAD